MLRRIFTLAGTILLVIAVSGVIYFNSADVTFKVYEQYELTLPLGVLVLLSLFAGGGFVFLLWLGREGRHAFIDWRVAREKRAEERNAEYRRQARSLTLAGDYQRARTLFAKASKRKAPDVVDVIDYAGTYLVEGRPSEARRILEEGQKDFGNDPLLLYGIHEACEAAGDPAAAISALERTLSIYPSSLAVLRKLRDLLFASELWGRALEVQERLTELAGQTDTEAAKLAEARFEHAMQKEGDEREAGLKQLVSASPEYVPAVIELAKSQQDGEDNKQAFKVVEKALRRKPATEVLDLAEELTPEAQAPRLVKLYAKLTGTWPEDAALRVRAAQYLLDTGRVDEAAKELEAIESEDHSFEQNALWAEIHKARSDKDQALAAYDAAIESHNEEGETGGAA